MLTLHYAPGTVSVASAILLAHTGTPHQLHKVDFSAAEQNQAPYLQINPKGRVPALITPDGILTETPAILEYIAPDLVPADPYAAARMRELMAYLNGTMHPHHAHKLRGSRWAREESSFADMRGMVAQRMAECAAYLEDYLPTLPFAVGDLTVVSDAYLYVVLSWLQGDGVDSTAYPGLTAFQDRMRQHDAVADAHGRGMFL